METFDNRAKSGLHHALQQQQQQQQHGEVDDEADICSPLVERTALHLPSSASPDNPKFLYLPSMRSDSSAPSDLNRYLQEHPELVQRAKEVHRSRASLKDLMERADSSTVLNVLQGEVAHVTSSHAEVLLSSDATTCHVVAVRSTSSSEANGSCPPPLTSLAHIDKCNPSCLEKIVLEHLRYHHQQQTSMQPLHEANSTQHQTSNGGGDDDDFGFFDAEQEETLQTPGFFPSPGLASPTEVSQFSESSPSSARQMTSQAQQHPKIRMELHIVGGCKDGRGTSERLSQELLQAFCDLSQKYAHAMETKLQTAVVSGLNACPTSGIPRSRGLGIDTTTGEVFGISESLPKHLEGPAIELRNARLWARSNKAELSCIHHPNQHTPGELQIEPFDYQPNPLLNSLLEVPDVVLKKVVSTSPDYESASFCADIRRTVSFLNTVPSSHAFPSYQPLRYSRSTGHFNRWEVSH